MMKSPLLVTALAAVVASPALEAITLLPTDIDFRAPSWSVINNQPSPQSIGDVTVLANVGRFTHSSSDGIGIDGGLLDFGDEIGLRELFTVSFTNGAGAGLTGIWVSDLFDESSILAPDAEKGFYSLNGAGWVPFFGANSDQSNGEQFIPFGSAVNATNLRFSVGTVLGANGTPSGFQLGSDFSVAGFSKLQPVTNSGQVPDSGGTVMLLGCALLGLGGARRFYSAK
jgi:VPDSG-CTERM motif